MISISYGVYKINGLSILFVYVLSSSKMNGFSRKPIIVVHLLCMQIIQAIYVHYLETHAESPKSLQCCWKKHGMVCVAL